MSGPLPATSPILASFRNTFNTSGNPRDDGKGGQYIQTAVGYKVDGNGAYVARVSGSTLNPGLNRGFTYYYRLSASGQLSQVSEQTYAALGQEYQIPQYGYSPTYTNTRK